MKKCVLDCQLGNCPQLLACDSIQTILIFFFFFGGGGSTPKNLKGFVWSFLSITGLQSQRQLFALKCSFLASRPLILDIVLSEYPGKSHNVRNFVLRMSSL